jgi:soluble lytic murein transglycosylase-like protein
METQSKSVPVLAAAAVAVALIGGIAFGDWRATKAIRAEVATESRAVIERDQKIMAVIVKKNPNATIKDFSGFPEFLVEESQKRGLDYRYVMAIIETESEWNPRAVSHAGAIGLMQVMPATGALVAKNMGIPFRAPSKDGLGDLGDSRANLVLGLTHLKGLIDSYGLGPAHLRAYNRGDVAAKAHWPGDRYAEDVALRFVRLSMIVPQ